MLKKILPTFLLVVCLVLLIGLLPKFLSSSFIIIGGAAGAIKGSGYDTGRLAGQAVAAIAIFGLLAFAFIRLVIAVRKK